MATAYDVSQSLLGPSGGQLALAFGAGCAAGYAFCIRTVYALLNKHSDVRHNDCMEQIDLLKDQNARLAERIRLLEAGTLRQLNQVHDSSVRLMEDGRITTVYRDKKYGPPKDD